ncbi:MAG TPA: hypothetical protein VND92_09650, partial [Vicinamibacterales bacterium]|nr:hypothetical protein [Vicinamibacterales bacterium]
MGPELLSIGRPASLQLELLALESLPCGCVAGDFRARPLDVEIVSIEAKGPHCLQRTHQVGEMLDLGDLTDDDEPADLALSLAEILDSADS